LDLVSLSAVRPEGLTYCIRMSAPATKVAVESTIAGSPEANAAWEASGHSAARGYSAVKRDVMVTVEGPAVLAAMSKI
jgi:hypothetical protein